MKGVIAQQCIDLKGKAIIFVNRYLTALYLVDCLTKTFGSALKVGCTVEKGKTSPQLKKGAYRSVVLKEFSPQSHNYKSDRWYDVLICTDADGVGVSLQDAHVLINYDPPKTADVLFQRVGRILRMTDDKHRTISVYTLTPSIVREDTYASRTYNCICKESKRMEQRHDKSRRILGSAVMSKDQQAEILLDQDIDVEQMVRDGQLLSEVGDVDASPGLNHTSVLEQHRSKAEQLPEWAIVSAKHYKQRKPQVIVLIKHKNSHHLLVFDIREEKLKQLSKGDVLDLVSCVENEPKAAVKPKTIEHYANKAAEAWCKQEGTVLDEVSKVCALYLAPKTLATRITDLLKPDEADKKRK